MSYTLLVKIIVPSVRVQVQKKNAAANFLVTHFSFFFFKNNTRNSIRKAADGVLG